MNEIELIQNKYEQLIKSGKVTKKDICNLLVPFKEKHGLTDLDTLSIARKDLSKTQIRDLMEHYAVAKACNITPYVTACGNMVLNIWWYMRIDNKLMILIDAREYNDYHETVKITLSQLISGHKALHWIGKTQQVDKSDYRRLKQEIIDNVLKDSDYRLDNLDRRGYAGN